jgi:hypothetical protein
VDRTVEIILADLQAATDQRKGVTYNPDLEARIEVLRLEYLVATEERRGEIEDTRVRRSKAK